MARSKRVLLVTVALVLCAGLVVGRLSARFVPPPPPQHDHSPSWLQDQLDLSASQKQQMDAVWADTRSKMDKLRDGRSDLDKQRDDAIHKLLTPEQQAAYQKIRDDYRAKRQDADKQRDALIHTAEDKSRALLTDSQKTTWDTMAKEWRDHHGPPGGRNGDHGDEHGGGPTSQGWHGMHDDFRGGPDHFGPPPDGMNGKPATQPNQ